MEKGASTRKRQRVEKVDTLRPPSSSVFHLTQPELKTSFEEAQAYFSEKGTFQCPFCANHINHNYLQTHIKYCSNLFEQFYSPLISKNVQQQLSLCSNVLPKASVTNHRIRCLIHGLRKEKATDTYVSDTLTKAGIRVKFANIKVPSAEAFPKQNNSSSSTYSELVTFGEDYYYNTEAKCYVEIESTHDEETLFILYNTFHKNTVTILPKQKAENFIRPNFNWYPDIMSVILSYFQSPPKNTKGFHQSNSYVQLFSEFFYSKYVSIAYWPFYFMKLAVKIDCKFYETIPLQWRSNKYVTIVALENSSKNSVDLNIPDIPPSLFKDVDVLVALSLTNPIFFEQIAEDKIDKKFVLRCLQYGCHSDIIESIPQILLRDGEFILKLLQQDCKMFHQRETLIPPEAFTNYEIICKLLAIDGRLLKVAPSFVKRNRKFVLIAVKQCGESLQFVEYFGHDREIALVAVQQSGRALNYTSSSIRCNKQIVTAAICNDYSALQFASLELQQDEELIQLVKYTKELKKPKQREFAVEMDDAESIFDWGDINSPIEYL